MADRQLSISIKAKDAVASGVKSAGKKLKAFGEGVVSAGKWAAAAIATIGASVVTFGIKAIQAYADQEKAVNDLKSALRSYGEDVDGNTAKLRKMASAIQNETGIDDDVTVARMARMRMLGMETDMLDRAAKAVIALAAAGMDEEQAMKAVAGATMGEYGALARYLPALKAATSETEKAKIVNDFLQRGYDQAVSNLGTVGGAWLMLKGRIGDAMEEIGGAIVRTGIIQRLLNSAADAAKRFGDRIAEWVNSAEFERVQNAVQGIADAVAQGGQARGEAMTAVGNLFKSAFVVAAEKAVNLLKEAAPAIGKLIGAAARAVLSGPAQEIDYKAAAAQLGIKTGLFSGAFGMRAGGVTEEQHLAIKRQMALNRQAEIFKELGIEGAKVVEGQTAAEIALANAILAVERIADRYRNKNKPAAAPAPGSTVGTVAAVPIDIAAGAQERYAKQQANIEAEKQLWHNIEEQRVKDRLAWIQQEIAAKEELAKKTVDQFIEDQKAGKKAQQAEEKAAERAEKLRAKLAKRGMKLSQRDQDWLAAWDKIQAARNAIPKLQNEALQLQQKQAQLLGKIDAGIARIADGLDQNLRFDGGIG